MQWPYKKTSQAESWNTYSDMMKYQFFLDSLYDQPEIQVHIYIYLREKAYTKTLFSCSLFYQTLCLIFCLHALNAF